MGRYLRLLLTLSLLFSPFRLFGADASNAERIQDLQKRIAQINSDMEKVRRLHPIALNNTEALRVRWHDYLGPLDREKADLESELMGLQDAAAEVKGQLVNPPPTDMDEFVYMLPKNETAGPTGETAAKIKGPTALSKLKEEFNSLVGKWESSPANNNKSNSGCKDCDVAKSDVTKSTVASPVVQLNEKAADLEGDKCGFFTATMFKQEKKRIPMAAKEYQAALAKRKKSKSKKPVLKYKEVPTGRVLKVQVDRDNSYLEDQIKENFSPSDYGFRKPGKTDIPHECVFRSQEAFPKVNHFSRCTSSKSSPELSDDVVRPCLSQKYHNLIYNSFTDVMNCFGVPQNRVFPTITRESGFWTNAYNAQNNGGLGQLTDTAIKEMNKRFFGGEKNQANLINSETQSLMDPSQSRVCQNISRSFNGPILSDPEFRCMSMALPANPIKNFIYVALIEKSNQKDMDQFLTDPEFGMARVNGKVAEKSDGLSLEQHLARSGIKGQVWDAIKKRFLLLSYNAGTGGAILTLKSYIRARGTQLSASDFDFTKIVDGNPGNFLNFVQNHASGGHDKNGHDKKVSGSRRETLATYVMDMLDESKKIEQDIAKVKNLKFTDPSSPEGKKQNLCIDRSLY